MPYFPHPEVKEDVRQLGGDVLDGPGGRATPNLRRHLDPDTKLPRWPTQPASTVSATVRESWKAKIRRADHALASAYAWMLLDAREHDAAIAITRSWRSPDLTIRDLLTLGEALTFRNQADDRKEARDQFRTVIWRYRAADGTRTYALVRLAETYRGGPMGPRPDAFIAGFTLALLARLVATFDDPSGVQASRADSAIGHFLLRLLEFGVISRHAVHARN